MSQAASGPAPRHFAPLRQLRLTVAALAELSPVFDPLRPVLCSLRERLQPLGCSALWLVAWLRSTLGQVEAAARRRHPTAAFTPAAAHPASKPNADGPGPTAPARPSIAVTLQALIGRLVGAVSRPANAIFLVALTMILTAWWVELRPTSFLGGPASFIVVRGTSMLPTLKTGDFVLAEAQSSYKVGDLVVYAMPKGQIGAGDELIHRIVGGDATSGYILKGDNNPAADPWTVPRSDILGKDAVVLRGAGGSLLVFRSPIFAGSVAAIIAITLVLWPPAWLRPRKRESGVVQTAADAAPRAASGAHTAPADTPASAPVVIPRTARPNARAPSHATTTKSERVAPARHPRSPRPRATTPTPKP